MPFLVYYMTKIMQKSEPNTHMLIIKMMGTS